MGMFISRALSHAGPRASVVMKWVVSMRTESARRAFMRDRDSTKEAFMEEGIRPGVTVMPVRFVMAWVLTCSFSLEKEPAEVLRTSWNS